MLSGHSSVLKTKKYNFSDPVQLVVLAAEDMLCFQCIYMLYSDYTVMMILQEDMKRQFLLIPLNICCFNSTNMYIKIYRK